MLAHEIRNIETEHGFAFHFADQALTSILMWVNQIDRYRDDEKIKGRIKEGIEEQIKKYTSNMNEAIRLKKKIKEAVAKGGRNLTLALQTMIRMDNEHTKMVNNFAKRIVDEVDIMQGLKTLGSERFRCSNEEDLEKYSEELYLLIF